MRIGLLTGSVLPSDLPKGEIVSTPYGDPSSAVFSLELGDARYSLIARHGLPPRIPPHRVNHRANIKALKDQDVGSIISVCSSGALKADLPVPSLAVVDDYIDLTPLQTFFEDTIHHATPSIDRRLRDALVRSSENVGMPCLDGGVYVQTAGPRLETRAEVRMLSGYADYVGMNLASEAGLCSELGIPFAGLLTVDNYANGIRDTILDFRNILTEAGSRWDTVKAILERVPANIQGVDRIDRAVIGEKGWRSNG